MKRFLLFLSAVAISASVGLSELAAQDDGPARQWTNAQGKSIEAVLLNVDGATAMMRLATGKVAAVPVASLSEADQALIAKMQKEGSVLPPLPKSAAISPSGSHFEISGQGKLEDDFLVGLEAIFAAADALPFGLDPKPGPNQDLFQVSLVDTAGYRSLLSSKQIDPNEKPNGAFLPDEVALFVNYTTIRADKMTPEKRAEINHEAGNLVLLRWKYVLPPWLLDGMAGCIASMPTRGNSIDIDGRELGLKQFLATRFNEGKSKPIHATGPEKLLRMKSAEWEPSLEDRAGAVVLTYYLMYLDDSAGGLGVPVSEALASVESMQGETENLLKTTEGAADDFERQRLLFNKQIAEYNEAVNKHRTSVMEYNARIATFNEQLKAGVPEGERIDVGTAPVPPVAPKKPDILMKEGGENIDPNAKPDGGDDFAAALDVVLPKLIRGRTGAGIQEKMEDAFRKIGLPLVFE